MSKHAFQIHGTDTLHITKRRDNEQVKLSDVDGRVFTVGIHSFDYVTDNLLAFSVSVGEDNFNGTNKRLGAFITGIYDFKGGMTVTDAAFLIHGHKWGRGNAAMLAFKCDAARISRFEVDALDAIKFALSANF